MTRLLITLNVMLILVLAGYMLTVNNTLDFLLQKPQANYYQRLGQGTFKLLNEAVDGMNQQQRLAKVQELQKQFIYPLRLQRLNELELSERQRKRLQQGLVAFREINDVDLLYNMMPGSEQWAWEAALDMARGTDETNSAAGTFYLLQQELKNHPQHQWQEVIAQRSSQFGFPLQLHKAALLPDKITLSTQQQQRLKNGEIVAQLHDEYSETLYQQIADSDYILQLGVIEKPTIARYINPLVFSLLFGLLILTSFFWLWPLWRDLMLVKSAAEQFGHGHYDTRVPKRKGSRMAPLIEAFNKMAEQTQRSIRAQKELTSAVSHELRTPVARMRFALDMLGDSDDPAAQQRYMSNMTQDMDELDLLLNELLTYARFDQLEHTLKMQWQPLSAWLDNTLKSLLPLSKDKNLTWQTVNITSDEMAFFEPLLMSRVINNLTQNALRYAENKVEVSLQKGDTHYQLSVSDDGPGIPATERDRLFEAFTTLDKSRSRHHYESGGFGLGLAIVKRIVDNHQGNVFIRESALDGAQIVVQWPQHQNQHQ